MAEDEQTIFSISCIAKMLHVHPQTLRFYERAGFVKPVRARGDTRLYSHQDIARLRLILHLTRDMGVNLAGVEIILRMQHNSSICRTRLSTCGSCSLPMDSSTAPRGCRRKPSSRPPHVSWSRSSRTAVDSA